MGLYYHITYMTLLRHVTNKLNNPTQACLIDVHKLFTIMRPYMWAIVKSGGVKVRYDSVDYIDIPLKDLASILDIDYKTKNSLIETLKKLKLLIVKDDKSTIRKMQNGKVMRVLRINETLMRKFLEIANNSKGFKNGGIKKVNLADDV